MSSDAGAFGSHEGEWTVLVENFRVIDEKASSIVQVLVAELLTYGPVAAAGGCGLGGGFLLGRRLRAKGVTNTSVRS